jgi:hypothetical protein
MENATIRNALSIILLIGVRNAELALGVQIKHKLYLLFWGEKYKALLLFFLLKHKQKTKSL